MQLARQTTTWIERDVEMPATRSLAAIALPTHVPATVGGCPSQTLQLQTVTVSVHDVGVVFINTSHPVFL